MKPLSPTLALARRPWRVSTSTMQQVLLPWVPAAVTREAAACITALHQRVLVSMMLPCVIVKTVVLVGLTGMQY